MNLDKKYKEWLENKFNVKLDYLCKLEVKYYNFDNEIKSGVIICNKAIYNDLKDIFKKLYEYKYQIEKIRLIDEYNFDDNLSMEDNNTSCFNYRSIYGTDKLSNHALGLAIDINPLYNPYILDKGIQPKNAYPYVDRNKPFLHKICEEDLCYKVFIAHGFSWGGYLLHKDYQHFYKII